MSGVRTDCGVSRINKSGVDAEHGRQRKEEGRWIENGNSFVQGGWEREDFVLVGEKAVSLNFTSL